MSKKLISLALAALMALSLAACGKTTVTLDKTEHTFTAAGETLQLTADTKADTLTWSSSDEAVATVDGSGLVTAVAPGTADITVSAGEDVTATCTVKCEWTVQVDLAAFYGTLFPDPDNAPAVMDLTESPEMLEAYYAGLSDIGTEQCLIYMPMISAVPFEIALIQVSDPADVAAVEAILQARIDSEIANQFNYPMVAENWELNSRVVSSGSYVMMVAHEQCDEFVQAFNALVQAQ